MMFGKIAVSLNSNVRRAMVFLLCALPFILHAQNPQPLSKEINSDFDELMPRISPDGSKMYFVRAFHPDNIGGTEHGQDIWVAEKGKDGSWVNPERIEEPLNSVYYNFIGGFSADGNTVYLGNVYNKKLGTILPGISVSTRTDTGWTFPKVLVDHKFLNAKEGSFSFCVEPNHNVMILSFARKEGHNDLYYSELDGEQWSKPKSIGTAINTTGDETCPYLSSDGQTLYFSSDGRGGSGGADVFYAKRVGEGWDIWEPPVNLGKKVNSSGFDGYFTMDPEGELAYFYSGKGAEELGDLYSIAVKDLGEDLVPAVVTVDEPVVDEPVVDVPDVDEPAVDEPVVDEPVVDVPAVDEPIVIFDTLRIKTDELSTATAAIPGLANDVANQNTSHLDNLGKPGKLEITDDGKSIRFVPEPDFVGITRYKTVIRVRDNENKRIRLFVEVEIERNAVVVDVPVKDEPVVDEPVVDVPVKDEPVVDEPVVDVPVKDEPIVDEPVVDEPVVDVPVKDEPVVTIQKDTEGETTIVSGLRPMVKVRGRIIDKETRLPIPADITFYEKYFNVERDAVTADYDAGEFVVQLERGKAYNLLADLKGFYTYGQNVDLRGNNSQNEIRIDIELARARPGKPVVLPLVRFEHNSATLTESSFGQLEMLASYLKLHEQLSIEIGGHTDFSGTEIYNNRLSSDRAKAVAEWLKRNGISNSRIRSKGYGESRPFKSNITEEGRAQNRRVEVTILPG